MAETQDHLPNYHFDLDEGSVGRIEARRILGGISSVALWRLTKSGRLPASRVGGKLIFMKSDLRAFILANRVVPLSEPEPAPTATPPVKRKPGRPPGARLKPKTGGDQVHDPRPHPEAPGAAKPKQGANSDPR
jgi:Helix-turn-helix domain